MMQFEIKILKPLVNISVFCKLLTYIIITFCLSLYTLGQTPNEQEKIKINQNEYGLVLKKSKFLVLNHGDTTILAKDDVLIRFNKTDTLNTGKFDVLDADLKQLICEINIVYFLTPSQIKNIVEKLEWTHLIPIYKKYLIQRVVKNEIRFLCENYYANNLVIIDSKIKAKIKEHLSKKLEKYINIISIEIEVVNE